MSFNILSASAFFRRDDYAACVSVDAVAQGRRKGVLPSRIPLALLRKIRLNVRNERVIVPRSRAVAQNARLFVGKNDVLILIDDVYPRFSDLEVGIFLARLFKKLIVYVQAQNIALGKARVALCALAV